MNRKYRTFTQNSLLPHWKKKKDSSLSQKQHPNSEAASFECCIQKANASCTAMQQRLSWFEGSFTFGQQMHSSFPEQQRI